MCVRGETTSSGASRQEKYRRDSRYSCHPFDRWALKGNTNAPFSPWGSNLPNQSIACCHATIDPVRESTTPPKVGGQEDVL